MEFTEKNLTRQAVGSLAEILYTVPVDTTAIIKDIQLCNNSNTNCYITIWFVPNNSINSDENVIFKEWVIPSNNFYHWNGYQVLDTPGDTIMALSEEMDKITVSISGAELKI